LRELAPNRTFRLRDGHAHAAFRQRARRGKSAIASADYGDVNGIGEFRRGGERRRSDSGRPVIFLLDGHRRSWREEILALTAAGKTIAVIRATSKKTDGSHMGSLPSRCVLLFLSEGIRGVYSSSPSRPSTGVMVPKSPSCSPLIPAVKNNVLAGPAVASFPNVSDHKPSMVKMESSGFFTKPRICR